MNSIYQSATTTVRFQNNQNRDFTKILNTRVAEYFKSNNKRKYANSEMVIKTIFMFSLYFIPYALLFVISDLWILFLLFFIMGVGNAGLGLSVMHDANHGAYSNRKWVNGLLGYTLNLIGGNATNWKIQHNVFHHTYTNIVTHDEDIRPRFILRFSPHARKFAFHKFQYIYAWFLYGFMTISWLFVKDFAQLRAYHRTGILEKHIYPPKAWAWLIASKLLYFFYALALPIIFTPFAWWQVLIGFILMQYVTGWILAVIFQPAHVMEINDFPVVNNESNIEDNWTIHQFKTTCNFAKKSRIFSWYVGGLNYQIEHHLFPNICHVHYRKIASIVSKTASEFNVPYHTMDTFREALIRHGKMLYKLGR